MEKRTVYIADPAKSRCPGGSTAVEAQSCGRARGSWLQKLTHVTAWWRRAETAASFSPSFEQAGVRPKTFDGGGGGAPEPSRPGLGLSKSGCLAAKLEPVLMCAPAAGRAAYLINSYRRIPALCCRADCTLVVVHNLGIFPHASLFVTRGHPSRNTKILNIFETLIAMEFMNAQRRSQNVYGDLFPTAKLLLFAVQPALQRDYRNLDLCKQTVPLHARGWILRTPHQDFRADKHREIRLTAGEPSEIPSLGINWQKCTCVCAGGQHWCNLLWQITWGGPGIRFGQFAR